MGTSKRGKASLLFEDPPLILSAASVVGKKEGEGPLGKYFDRIEMDSMLGKRTWEEAESELQTRTARLAIEKSGLDKEEIRYYFGGDLLAQLIATSFGSMDLEFPMFGLYGACSTMGEGLQLGSHDRGRRFCRPGAGNGLQPFCIGGKAVPLPPGVWEPEAAFCHMDRHRLRGRGPGKRRRREPAGPGGRDHHRKDRGHGF